MDMGFDSDPAGHGQDLDLRLLAQAVQDSLDPMGEALARVIEERTDQTTEELVRAFMNWAFPTHTLAHLLNEFYVNHGHEIEGLREMAYALAPFNHNMVQVLEDKPVVADMAVGWMGVRECCERVLENLPF